MVVEVEDVVSEKTQKEPGAGRDASAAAEGSGPKKRGGGPRTTEGKNKARMNALKDGGHSKVVFTEEMKADIAKYQKIFTEEFEPRTPYEILLVYDMSVARAKVDHYEQLVLDDIDRVVERVLDYWEDDRRTWALNLAARLAADPARVAHKLAQKKHGAEHMIGLWEGLARALESQPDWDEEQRRLASDLLGVRPELRSARAPLPPAGDTAALAALAAGEIERLRKDVEERLGADDESTQIYILAGMPVEPDALTRLLERYRKGFRNEYDRALAELRNCRGEAAPGQGATRKPYRSPNGVPPVADRDTTTRPKGAAASAGRESGKGKGQGPQAAASPVEETHAAEDVRCTVVEQTGDAQDTSPEFDDEGASASASESETGTEDLGVAGAEESEFECSADESTEAVFATAFAASAATHEPATAGAPGVVAARSASFTAAMPNDPPLSRRARKAREKQVREAMKKQRRMNRSA